MSELLKLARGEMGIAEGGSKPLIDFKDPAPGRRPDPGSQAPAHLSPGAEVRGSKILRLLERGFNYLDHFVDKFLPPALNPFAQIGAVANACFVVALASGIALLIWYSPSVHQAYSSLETMRQASWLGEWARSLHRYSSDGCVFLILLHALRMFLARRFTGPRGLAWATGVALLALVWFIGWTGYWLVWDVRAKQVALGAAKFLDCLPIATEPLARSFLTDQSINSLLFFLVFFVHMLAPLAVGVALWMHLMRVSRAKLFPPRKMLLWVVVSLAVLSALLPATSAGPAQMTVKVPRFTLDWWFLWPLALTDRLGGGMLWSLFLILGLVAGTVPWWLLKRRLPPERKASVELSRCFGCTHCSKDCPFNAITMVPREDERNFPVQSLVDPALCTGCGVCVGACDSQAINLPSLDSRKVGQRLAEWIQMEVAEGRDPFLAFVCQEVADSELSIDAQGSSPDLPGYQVCPVPCVGWVSAVLVERALQQGARGVLIVGCGSADPVSREGGKWLRQRLDGKREPKFDLKAGRNRVRFVQYDRSQRAEFGRDARDFAEGALDKSTAATRKPAWLLAFGVALAIGLGALTAAFSSLPYRAPLSAEPELVISFMHCGETVEERAPTKEELASRLPHMRAQVNLSRERAPVRLRVTIDGTTVLDRAYKPKGISGDGPSLALERLPLAAGIHKIQVQIADTTASDKWTYQWNEPVEFKPQQTRVLLFETKAGFTLN